MRTIIYHIVYETSQFLGWLSGWGEYSEYLLDLSGTLEYQADHYANHGRFE